MKLVFREWEMTQVYYLCASYTTTREGDNPPLTTNMTSVMAVQYKDTICE